MCVHVGVEGSFGGSAVVDDGNPTDAATKV